MSVEELVKRLRGVDHMSVEDCFLQSHLFGHAADKLEELAAENEQAAKQRDMWIEAALLQQRKREEAEAALTAERAALAEARKALEPFALVAEHDISEDEADSDAFRPMPKPFNHAPQITVGHLRAARSALEGEQEE